MRSLFRFRWLGTLGVCLYALQACATDDALTNSGPPESLGGGPPTGGTTGTSGTSGSGGSDSGGMGGDGGEGGDLGGTGSGHAGDSGMPGGAGAGGEGGGGSVDPVSVVSATLPDATLNQDYRFAFEANGGSGEGYAFSLEGGALPRGLTIAEDGTLSGIPLEGGDFELDLVVTDSGGRTARATLRLHVRQSRWLTYWNLLSGNVIVPRFSAIDLASPDFERRNVGGMPPPDQNGPDSSTFAFSPDGRFAVFAFFIYGDHVGNQPRLVDFDRFADFDWDNDDPNFVVTGEEQVQVYGPSWSPDSKRVAVMSLIENAAHELRSPGRLAWFDSDEVLGTPGVSTNLKRRPEGAGTDFVEWVSSDTVVYRSQGLDENENPVMGPIVKATWQGDAPGAPSTILDSSGVPYDESNYLHYLNPATKTAAIARFGNPHCIASIELYNFTNDQVVNLGETPLLPGPALDRFAGVSDSILKIVDAQNQPLAMLAESDCNLIDWSPDGTMLAWVDTANKNYRVTTLGANGQAQTALVPASTYATSAGRPQFSSDGRWLGYRADDKQLFVARMDETGIHDAVPVSVTLAADTDRIGSFQFSPNGRALVYVAAGQIAGLDDLYFVDLSGDTPGMSRRISPDLSGFPDGDRLTVPPPDFDYDEYTERRFPIWNVWTPDSAKVFFTVHDSGGQVGDALYVVDVLAPQPAPVRVDVGLCDSSACGTINVVTPQPPR